MKLLKLEIGDLPKEKQFRSLHAGFKVEFHSLDNKGIKAMESFSPFCFAGLNGSGKSNVLEALAAIFYHLESCVAKFKPKTFATHFRPNECNPDAFTLEYLIGQHNSKPYTLEYFDKIIIKKEIGKAPLMWRQRFPFSKEQELIPVSLEPKTDLREPQAAEGKDYLPEIIVGYSSGENEILSLPFRKSRLINFDKYREDYIKGYKYEEPENSLIYIDAEMSQAVLLACLLYEDEETLKPLRKELGIVSLRSFRMNLNVQGLILDYDRDRNTHVPILQHIANIIEDLKKCSSCWQEIKHQEKGRNDNLFSVLTLDFFVDEKTKQVFKSHFTTSIDLFRFFQVLYELNSNVISESIKKEVYKSKGFYTDGKLPEGSPDENVFYFLDYLILKEIEGEIEPKQLLLREFSDGEYQFLHTMGICLMLKERKSILLLDEPETHFNPSWRAKFIKILDDSIKAASKDLKYGSNSVNINLLKDILLTSHSPFIISDCVPNNVIFFDRNAETKKIQARKASELGFNTYGTSVEIILDELFDYNQSIGDLSNEILKQIDFQSIKSKEDIEKTKGLFSHLGESIEKDLVLARLNQIKLTT
jgi:restriction system-associated AAA family ATPase